MAHLQISYLHILKFGFKNLNKMRSKEASWNLLGQSARRRDVTRTWEPRVAAMSRCTGTRPGSLCAPSTGISCLCASQAGASAGGATQATWRARAPTEPDPRCRARPPRKRHRSNNIFARNPSPQSILHPMHSTAIYSPSPP